MKQRLLIKLSGAALKDKKDGNIFSSAQLTTIAKQIKTLSKTCGIAIVVGGGNIWRGNMYDKKICREEKAHYMGMIATIINSMYLCEAFHAQKIPSRVLSLLPCPNCCQTYTPLLANQCLNNNEVIILAGGTGKPFFSTDTGATKCASEIKASTIYMAKDGVDGVYSNDPKTSKKAVRYQTLNMSDCIKQKLKFMDASAMNMCIKHRIKVVVFNMERPNAIIGGMNKTIPTTIINPK